MDMDVLSLCLIAIATVFILPFLILIAAPGHKTKKCPPGPWMLPIIGSLHHLSIGLPHRTMMELSRRHGPVMFLKLGEIPTVVVSSAEAAEVVMKSMDLTFATRPRNATLDILAFGGKGITLAPYGEHWRQMRKVCILELLSAKQVKRMESIRVEEVDRLLCSVAGAGAGGVVNLSEKVSALANDVVARAVFGGKCPHQGDYLRELGKVTALAGGSCLVDLFPSSRLVKWLSSGEGQMRRSCARIERIIGDIIQGRKVQRHGACNTDEEDLLDVLLNLQEDNSMTVPLTSEAIGVVIFDVFGAASETSSTALEWVMSELLNNPEALAKAHEEVREVLGQERGVITNTDLGDLHYMRMVIKEVFRLHPPAPLLVPREAREDCEIMGYDVSKGTHIHINVFAISRDAKNWDNPEVFNPERFNNSKMDYKGANYEFTPFGAGRRQCPGMLFGTSTVEIVLANLLYHFDWELPQESSKKSIDMSEKFGMTVGKRSDLQLKAIPRVSSKVAWI